MRIVLSLALVLGMASPGFAAMDCETRSRPDAAEFVDCVSADYAPTAAMIDGVPPTSNPLSRYQWNLRQILEGESYGSVLGDAPRDVKIAVIDRYPGSQGHPDLVNRYETGINTVEGGTNANPPIWDGKAATGSNAHGQCIASIIASEHGSSGLAGVFHRARIIPVRASFDTLETAIDLAVAAGAEVIHIAGYHIDQPFQNYAMFPDLGLPSAHPLRWMMRDAQTAAYERARLIAIRGAIERAVWDHNVVITTVVANWDGRITTYMPAQIHETIVSGAVNVLGEPSPFNSTSHTFTLLAPGGDRRAHPWLPHAGNWISEGVYAGQDDVPCAIGPDRYTWGTGGSFSGPHIAAAAAVVKSYLPDATAQDVRRLLVRGSQPLTLTNLHLLSANPGKMLSLKRLRAAIAAE
jgi:subtilisin family serine protease